MNKELYTAAYEGRICADRMVKKLPCLIGKSKGKIMTTQEFKTRWESNDSGGGITFDDIADCAKEWEICSTPRIIPIDKIRYSVLLAAGTKDAEEFKPESNS